MVDTVGTQSVLGVAAPAAVLFDPTGNFVPQNALRIGGSIVSTANPLPVLDINSGTISANGVTTNALLGSIVAGGVKLAAGAAAIGTVAVSGTVPVSLTALPALAAGANKIGNAGVAPLTYTLNGAGTVTTSSAVLLAAAAAGTSVTLQNNGAVDVWLNPTGGAAVVGLGAKIFANGGSYTYGTTGNPLPTGAITAIVAAGSASVSISGG